MTTSVDLYQLRRRPVMSGRALTDAATERFQSFVARAEALRAAPFTGITTDGTPQTGLFSLHRTGIATAPIADAAGAFLRSLTEVQRDAAGFDLDGAEWMQWFNVHPFVMRHGALLEEMSAEQRTAALGILGATLSATGFETARDVMRLNETIGEMTESWEEYGEWLYWLSVFGTPAADQPWGWQIDGHHLNINCFVLGDQIVMTPTFMGSEPVEAPSGKYAGTRVFADEERQGLELVRSLTPGPRQQAILSHTVTSTELAEGRFRGPDGRVQGGAFQDNAQLPYEGLCCDDLTPAQQRFLLSLVETYTGRMQPEHAAIKLAEVKRHLPETYFAWMGGTDEDSVFYYRIHSPVLLIEFDHESGVAFDNPEPTRTHIHTIVRTPNGNDYGKDLLRQHREQFHRKP